MVHPLSRNDQDVVNPSLNVYSATVPRLKLNVIHCMWSENTVTEPCSGIFEVVVDIDVIRPNMQLRDHSYKMPSIVYPHVACTDRGATLTEA